MRTRALLVSLPLVGACGSSPDQVEDAILSFEEWTIDSEKVPVGTDPAFVDINSTIRVKVDRDELRARLLEEGGDVSVDRRVLDVLQKSVDALETAVPRMQDAFDAWQASEKGADEQVALVSGARRGRKPGARDPGEPAAPARVGRDSLRSTPRGGDGGR